MQLLLNIKLYGVKFFLICLQDSLHQIHVIAAFLCLSYIKRSEIKCYEKCT